MTGTQAINKAMAVFNKEGKGDIRTVALMEGSGCGNKWSQIRIHIGYAIDNFFVRRYIRTRRNAHVPLETRHTCRNRNSVLHNWEHKISKEGPAAVI